VKQHTLPRFYIAGFYADRPSKDPLVWVYTLPDGPWKRERAKKISVREDYYTDKRAPRDAANGVERSLKVTEDRAAEPIQKLARGEAPTAEDMIHLAIFLAAMISRSPRLIAHVGDAVERMHREDMRKLYERAKSDPKEFEAILAEMRADGFDTTGITSPEVFALLEQLELVLNTAAPAALLLSTAIQSVVRLLLTMQWDVLSTTGDAPFVTCDMPVAMYLPGVGLIFGGIGEPYIEVTLALNKTTAVRIHHRAKLPVGALGIGFRKANPDVVADLNRRTIALASEFVVASATMFPGDDAIAKKASPHQRNGPDGASPARKS
jgi:hypothetical protein